MNLLESTEQCYIKSIIIIINKLQDIPTLSWDISTARYNYTVMGYFNCKV